LAFFAGLSGDTLRDEVATGILQKRTNEGKMRDRRKVKVMKRIQHFASGK